MGKSAKRGMIIAVISIALLLETGFSYAQDVRSFLNENIARQKDICQPVQSAITERFNTAEVVATAIRMGYNACSVIHCSLQCGGSLEGVINGAVAAGATADVVSRCCLEAGAGSAEVAMIMRRDELIGLGYVPAEDGAAVVIGFPGGGRNSGVFVSPSRF